jgi:hypothetical protein
MPDDHSFTLRQVDLQRSDFAVIQEDLEFLKAQLARVPTRRNLLDMAIVGAFWAAGLVLVGEWLLFR